MKGGAVFLIFVADVTVGVYTLSLKERTKLTFIQIQIQQTTSLGFR